MGTELMPWTPSSLDSQDWASSYGVSIMAALASSGVQPLQIYRVKATATRMEVHPIKRIL